VKNFVRGAAALFALLLITSARATIMTPLPVEDLSQRADLILHGTITNKVCLQDDAGRIYTRLDLAVTEVWKGELATNHFRLIQWGGTLNGITTVVGGEAVYEIGEEVVSFIRVTAPGEGLSIGLAQGKFNIWRDRNGTTFAHSLFHGEPREPELPAAAELRRAAGPGKRLGLAELKQRATGGRP
jgi:hypothetical protein